jgi:hypothetical protein
MQFFSPARARAGLAGLSVLALVVTTANASTSFAAEQASPIRLTTIHQQEMGIIMRDGGVCDPIRHMGC